MLDSGIFLAKLNYIVDLRLIGGAVDVKIIQVAEPPVTKTMAFIDAFIMKAHTGIFYVYLLVGRYVKFSRQEHGEAPSTRATGAARSSQPDRDVRIMRLILSRGEISHDSAGCRRGARRRTTKIKIMRH